MNGTADTDSPAPGESRWSLRKARPEDAEFLTRMLVLAFNWSTERRQFTQERVLREPRAGIQVLGWPLPGDFGMLAVSGTGRPVGAAWARVHSAEQPGYGFVDAATPELALGVREDWRGHGIGRALLRALLQQASEAGHPQVSLSVERANHAWQLYRSEGFTVHSGDAHADTMVCRLPVQRG